MGMDTSTSLGMHKESRNQDNGKIWEPKSSLGSLAIVHTRYILRPGVIAKESVNASHPYESELECK